MCAGVCLSSELHEYSAHTAVISAVREYLLRALHGHFPAVAQDINHCININACVYVCVSWRSTCWSGVSERDVTRLTESV